jgi:O-antigen/teichoic acid export membrane protein
LYAIANKLGTMAVVLTTAAWSAWWPIALEMANTPDAPRQFGRMFEYFVSGAMLLALAIGLFSPEILSVFTRSVYVPAAPYALVLLIYYGPLSYVLGFFEIGFFVRKRTQLVSARVAVGAVVNIVLNLILIPLIGVWGAVWATVIAGAVMAATSYVLSQRTFAVPYNMGRFAVLAVVYLCFVLLFAFVPALNLWPLKIAALAIFLVVILVSGVVTPEQMRIATASVRYRMARVLQGK